MQNMPRPPLKGGNQNLVNARLQRGWTQREVAEAVGTTLANVSRWERGVTFPSPYFRQKLCEVFEMSPEDLNLTLARHRCLQRCDTQQEQKDSPTSRNRFWNFERMFFFLFILLMFIISRAKEGRGLLKGA